MLSRPLRKPSLLLVEVASRPGRFQLLISVLKQEKNIKEKEIIEKKERKKERGEKKTRKI